MSNPLTTALKRAYDKSHTKRLDDLLAEQSRWQRKQTIATNKLAWVRARIDALAKEYVEKLDGVSALKQDAKEGDK